MRSLTAILILALIGATVREIRTDINYARLRNTLSNFTFYSYDALHQLAVLDQIDAYLKPIKSIETRNSRSLDGLYDFCFDPEAEGFTKRWFEGPLVDTCHDDNYYRMPVPSAFNDILSNKTAKNYVGWMWYQTSMFWQAGQQVHSSDWILQIDSINYFSIIWLQLIHGDGEMESHLVGSHVGGHLPITMNISTILNGIPNGTSQVRVTIAVSNLLTQQTIPSGQLVNMTDYIGRPYFKFQPDFDFFNFAGIMGHVRLVSLPRYFIEDVDILPPVEQQLEDRILVRLCLNKPLRLGKFFIVQTLEGTHKMSTSHHWSSSREGGRLGNRLEDDPDEHPEGKCKLLNVCKDNPACKSRLRAMEWPLGGKFNTANKVRFSLRLSGYHTDGQQVTASVAEHDYDSFELRFVRRPRNILELLANSSKQLQGFGMHHEQLFSGRTMSLASIMKDLYLLKQMGANVIRTSHYPYSSAYLEACDELGLMVIAECPAVGLGTFSDIKLMLHKQILLEMMQRDHGHPSIVMWSLANEPQSQLPESRGYFESLVQYARNDLRRFTVDAGRPLTAALAQSHHDDKIGQLFDVLMINRYYGWYECTGSIECIRHSLLESLRGWSDKYGHKKPLLVSEFGADTLAGFHSITSEIFSEEFQRDLIVAHERLFDELAANRTNEGIQINFLGAMIWNFADFSTHESLLRVGGNKKGIFTSTREPKLAAASVKQIYRSRPTIKDL